jgi:hypothetical protein
MTLQGSASWKDMVARKKKCKAFSLDRTGVGDAA